MTAQPTAAPGPVSRAEETRQRFVDAAVTLFKEHGYGATSMSQVAAAAGSSRANLYLYFHSKSEIVLEWMLELRPELDRIYSQLDHLPEYSVQSCRAWLAQVVAVWRAHPEELDAMEQAMTEDSDVHRARVELCRETAAGLQALRRGSGNHQGGELPSRELAARQVHMVSLMLGTESCLSSMVLHEAILDEDLFLNALASQWSTLLNGLTHC